METIQLGLIRSGPVALILFDSALNQLEWFQFLSKWTNISRGQFLLDDQREPTFKAVIELLSPSFAWYWWLKRYILLLITVGIFHSSRTTCFMEAGFYRHNHSSSRILRGLAFLYSDWWVNCLHMRTEKEISMSWSIYGCPFFVSWMYILWSQNKAICNPLDAWHLLLDHQKQQNRELKTERKHDETDLSKHPLATNSSILGVNQSLAPQ